MFRVKSPYGRTHVLLDDVAGLPPLVHLLLLLLLLQDLLLPATLARVELEPI
jgi:hypothetical protein